MAAAARRSGEEVGSEEAVRVCVCERDSVYVCEGRYCNRERWLQWRGSGGRERR